MRELGPWAAAACLTLGATVVAWAGDDEQLVAIRAGAAITVTGEELRPAVIVIRDGKIEAVGERVDVPPRAKVIEAGDEVVMPGLILARSRFGMAPRVNRTGNNAHLTALDELTLRPGELDPLLEAGFVAAALVPGGRGVAGFASVVRPYLDGAGAPVVLEGAGYLRISMSSLPSDKRALAAAFDEAKQLLERIEKAREEWEKKRKAEQEKAEQEKAAKEKAAPAKGKPKGNEGAGSEGKKDAPEKEPEFTPPPLPTRARPFAAILQESDDRPRVLVEVGRACDVVHFDDGFGRYAKLEPAFLASTRNQCDLFYVQERLARTLVVLDPVLSLEPDTQTLRNLPAELAGQGAKVAFVPLGDDDDDLRGLLEAVAFLVRDGLPRDVALKALTLHPAELLGLGSELGAIEAGRRADLVFLSGDPLGASPRVTRVMIGGVVREPEGASR